MKIQGPGQSQKTDKSKKSSSTSGSSGGGFGVLLGTQDVEDAPAASQAHSVAKIDALLAVQATEDPTERKKRQAMTQRADRLLDELNKMRLNLLTGTLQLGHLIDLADVVSTHKERIQNPELQSVLDEIDLRAQIEIAKMRVSLKDII